MQKYLNALSAVTFVIAACNAAVLVMVFTRGPSLVKKQISELRLELTQTILDQVPVPEMPKLPTETGPAITSPF